MITGNRITLVQLRARSQIVSNGSTGFITLVSSAMFSDLSQLDLRPEGWLNMTSYFATAFKTGSYPPISKDKIVMWSRPHPAFATAPDPVGRPANYQIVSSLLDGQAILVVIPRPQTADKLWVVVFATSPATVTLSTSSTESQTFKVGAGMTKLSLAISAGGYMEAVLQRNGQTVINLRPEGFYFNPSPPSYNFNALVVSSS